jgi:hypothetical protein
VRRLEQLVEAILGERGDFGERLASEELRRKLSRNSNRNFDRLGFEAVLDSLEARRERGHGRCDALERARSPPLGLGPQLRFGRSNAIAVAARFGLRNCRLMHARGDRRLGFLLARAIAEIDVEEVFCLRSHCKPQ